MYYFSDALHVAMCNRSFNGYVHIAKRARGDTKLKNVYAVKRGELDDALDHLTVDNDADYYITANRTSSATRRKDNLISYHNIVIDLDRHDGADVDIIAAAKGLLLAFEERDSAPLPNVIHYTGRGVQLWWVLDGVSADLHFLYHRARTFLLSLISDLVRDFKIPLELDKVASSNDVGFFRLFDTYNTKAGSRTAAEILSYDVVTLEDILRSAEDEAEREKEVSQRPENEPETKENCILPLSPSGALDYVYANLHYQRAALIEWLIGTRRRAAGAEMRDINIFLYYNARVQINGRDMAKKAAQRLNKKFMEPLDERKMRSIFSYIDQKGALRFRNDTFSKWLSLTAGEKEKFLKVYRPKMHLTRDLERKQRRAARDALIFELHESGFSVDAISNEAKRRGVNVSSKTVHSVLKKAGKTATSASRAEQTQRIFDLLKAGKKKAEIAAAMKISVKTLNRRIKAGI